MIKSIFQGFPGSHLAEPETGKSSESQLIALFGVAVWPGASSLKVNSWVELSSFYYKEKFENYSVKQTLHGKIRCKIFRLHFSIFRLWFSCLC